MGRKIYLPLIMCLAVAFSAFSQTGEIRGRILEKGGKEGVPFASVAALQGGVQVIASVTDLDGNYTLKPLNPGKYDVKATCVGYSPQQTSNVLVTVDKISFANIELGKGIELKQVEVTEYTVPLIDKGSPSTQKTVTYEEIQAAPLRDINSIASTTAGVAQEDAGKELNIRGSRSDATSYYVDGIKVRGSSAVATKAAEQITVITGGLPAQYGDATGGVISISTRGPSKEWSGGIEASTSKYLDDYENSTVSFDLSGPVLTKKDADGKKSGQPTVGFFLAGDFSADGDPSPSSVGAYKVKDNILDDVRLHPIIKTPSGLFHRSIYFTNDSLEKIKSRSNVASRSFTLNGKLDFKLLSNLNLSLGGSYTADSSNDYIALYSLMNYDNNPQTINNTWRAYAKLTQRFGGGAESQKSASAIKGGFYTIQADISQTNTINQSSAHKDNIWNYGYVGQFTQYRQAFYSYSAADSELTYNTSNAGTVKGNFPSYVFYADTFFAYTPGGLNPYTEAYTNQYYELTDNTNGDQVNADAVGQGGGWLNGDNRGRSTATAYGLFGTTGRLRNFYGKTQINQFSVKASGQADIKNHTLVLGMEYEKRSDRNYSMNPSYLWTFAKQYGQSFNIQTNDTVAHLIVDPTYETTWGNDSVIFYDQKYVATLNHDGEVAHGFFENLRDKLGVPYNQWVDMDHIKPDFYNNSVELFAPDQLLDQGIIGYYGYDFLGNKTTTRPSLNDYYTKKDSKNNFTRLQGAFEPIYVAGYIQDRFNFNDLTFNIGLRVDRFDANQPSIKDQHLLYPAYTAGSSQAKSLAGGNVPDNIGDDYVVYVNNIHNPTKILGYRNGDKWYDAVGNSITDVKSVMADPTATGTIQPYLQTSTLIYDDSSRVDVAAFKNYEPQTTFMPRIAFSFPISDEANFKAHYDILTQRPSNNRFDPRGYLNWATNNGTPGSNPDLKPEQTTDYEIEFEQKLSRSSAFSISAFYKELRDMIEIVNVQFAYPTDYTTYGNIDFGTVKGLTFSYDLRRNGNVRLDASYTLQFANGTGSSPTSNGTLAGLGQTNLRELIPLDFDQRHTLVTSIDYHYASGKDYNGPVWFNKQFFADAGLNLVLRANSGRPYTRYGNVVAPTGNTFGGQKIAGTVNGSRKPWNFRMDAKFDKSFNLKMGKTASGESKRSVYLNVYILVQNVFDTQNIIGVYGATGSADDDGYLSAPAYQNSINNQLSPAAYRDLYAVYELDPSHYSLPRRTRLGIQLNF